MERRPAIVVESSSATRKDGFRLLALLCMIEFYWLFVRSGYAIWANYYASRGQPSGEELDLWLPFVTALLFLALARSLWTKSRAMRLFAGLTAGSLALGVLQTVSEAPWENWRQAPFAPSILPRPWADLGYNSWPLLWMGALILIARGGQKSAWLNSWRIMAAGGAAVVTMLSLLATIPTLVVMRVSIETGLPLWLAGDTMRDLFPSFPPWLCWFALVPPVLTIVALQLRSRWAALFASVTAILEAVPAIQIGYALASLTFKAIHALITSTPGHPQNQISWPGLLLNQVTFDSWEI